MRKTLTNTDKKVLFLGEQCSVQIDKYAGNGRPAIQLICADGEPMTVATVNIPDCPVPSGYVLIKDYSENRGIYQALLDADVIEPRTLEVPAGRTDVLLCKLRLTPAPKGGRWE